MRNLRYLLALVATLLVVGMALGASTPPKLDEAVAAQKKLAAEYPQDARVFNDLGNLLLLVQESTRAEEAYRRAVELDPGMASAYFNLGLLDQQDDRLDQAMDSYRKAIELAPDHAWAHYQVGALLEAKGRPRRAVQSYARAFRLDPDLSFADVNAHVIDSQLTERALMEAFGTSKNKPTAPKIYQQPERIVALMVSTEDTESEQAGDAMIDEDPMAATKAAGAKVQPKTRSLPPVDEQALDNGQGEGANRVLRARDLDGRNGLNQAAPSGGRGSQGARYRPGTSQKPSRSWTRPVDPSGVVGNPLRSEPPIRRLDSTGRPIPQPQGNLDTGRGQGNAGTPSGGRVRYRPGVNSTGRLEIDLMPLPAIPEVAPAG